jgi:hypothetical protein
VWPVLRAVSGRCVVKTRVLRSLCARAARDRPCRLDLRCHRGRRRRDGRQSRRLGPTIRPRSEPQGGRRRPALVAADERRRRRPPMACLTARLCARRLRGAVACGRTCRRPRRARRPRAHDTARVRLPRRGGGGRRRRLCKPRRPAGHRPLGDHRRLDRRRLLRGVAPLPLAARSPAERARLRRLRVDRLRLPPERDGTRFRAPRRLRARGRRCRVVGACGRIRP